MRKNLRSEQEIMKNWKGNTPIVSVCSPTFNHEKYIEDALEGFLIQETNFPFEVIIHDDASTDNTAKIIREYEKKYPNIIKPIYQTTNQYKLGIGISKTFLFPIAKGEYIALCECDDYWTDKNKLQIQIDYMRKNPNCSMTCHAYNWINPDNSIKEIKFGTKDFTIPPDSIINSPYPYQSATRVIKKEILLNMPILFPNLGIGDYPILLFALLQGEIHYINRNMSTYRYCCEGSWTFNNKKNKEKKLKNNCNVIRFLKKYNEYSFFKYKNEIEKRIDYIIFNNALITYNYRLAYKYIKKFKKVSKTRKILTLLGILFPFFIRNLEKAIK